MDCPNGNTYNGCKLPCSKAKVCKCPQTDCPNHGNCGACTAKHVRLGTGRHCDGENNWRKPYQIKTGIQITIE